MNKSFDAFRVTSVKAVTVKFPPVTALPLAYNATKTISGYSPEVPGLTWIAAGPACDRILFPYKIFTKRISTVVTSKSFTYSVDTTL